MPVGHEGSQLLLLVCHGRDRARFLVYFRSHSRSFSDKAGRRHPGRFGQYSLPKIY
jgi:hypothetical protein